jgi:hypothetical protein
MCSRHWTRQRLTWGNVLIFIGPCIIAIVDEWKTNLMSLAILFHLLCAQHVSDINISIFRSLRLCWWITTSVVLFSVRCVLEFLLRLIFGVVRFAGFSFTQRTENKTTDVVIYQHSRRLLKMDILMSEYFVTWSGYHVILNNNTSSLWILVHCENRTFYHGCAS